MQEGSLGEMHTCKGPGASCVPARPCRVFPRPGSKTTDNEKSLGTRTGLPVRVRNVSKSAGPSGDGVSTLRGAQLVTARRLPVEQARNVNGVKRPQMLLTPEEEMAGELRHAMGA